MTCLILCGILCADRDAPVPAELTPTLACAILTSVSHVRVSPQCWPGRYLETFQRWLLCDLVPDSQAIGNAVVASQKLRTFTNNTSKSYMTRPRFEPTRYPDTGDLVVSACRLPLLARYFFINHSLRYVRPTRMAHSNLSTVHYATRRGSTHPNNTTMHAVMPRAHHISSIRG